MKSILFSILITLSFNNTICDGGLRTNQIVFSEKSSFNASDNTVTHIVSLENDSDQVYYSWLSPLNSSDTCNGSRSLSRGWNKST